MAENQVSVELNAKDNTKEAFESCKASLQNLAETCAGQVAFISIAINQVAELAEKMGKAGRYVPRRRGDEPSISTPLCTINGFPSTAA